MDKPINRRYQPINPSFKSSQKGGEETQTQESPPVFNFAKLVRKNRKWFLLGVGITLFILSAVFVTLIYLKATQTMLPSSYEECVKMKGSVIQEIYPEICVTKNGERFTRKISDQKSQTTNLQQACERGGGKWLAAYQECEGINKATCETAGGTFKECASPCRNEPGDKVCIQVCVAVCSLKQHLPL